MSNNIPAQLKYTTTHEWIRLEDDGCWTVGITFHAQELLGDLVFVELPVAGKRLSAGQEAVVVESVKAAADAYAPADGEVVAINQTTVDHPDLINRDPYLHWLFRLRPDQDADYDRLLDAVAYAAEIGVT